MGIDPGAALFRLLRFAGVEQVGIDRPGRNGVDANAARRDLEPPVVAEIDSLSLLMSCVHDGMGVTIKPMSALQLEADPGKRWRALSISDGRIARRNYLYSI